MYIFVDFHQSVHKRFQIFYPEHIFYPKFKKEKWLTELSKLMTETQTDSVYRLIAVCCPQYTAFNPPASPNLFMWIDGNVHSGSREPFISPLTIW